MIQSVLLVIGTALITWFVMRWLRSGPVLPKALSAQQHEMDSAKQIGTDLDGARDRASLVEVERNKLALAKVVKAALWVTETRLNVAVPELLKTVQRWGSEAEPDGSAWQPPEGVTDIEGLDDEQAPWGAWSFDGRRWRIEAQWPSVLPEEADEAFGTCKVFVDEALVLDMTVSSEDLQVMWIDALSVGPWVSELLAFTGAQTYDAKARSSDKSARENQDRADKIHWS